MSSSQFTPQDIIAIKKKYPDEPILRAEIIKTKKNANSKQPTYYIPITAKNLAGKQLPLSLKFARQVLGSSAKIPYGTSEEEARDVRISFRKITKHDLESSEYSDDKFESLIKANNEFIEALNIIANDYIRIAKDEILTYKGDKFKLNKCRTINCFRQSEREAADGEAADENGKVLLENPIFRIKIPADMDSKKLGFNSEKSGHIYIVFDAKRTSAEAKEKGLKVPKQVVAKIKNKNGFQDLTTTNAKHFITYMSLTLGTIHFDSICISKSGVSLMCKIKELNVWRHKPSKIASVTNDDMADFTNLGTGGDDDLDVEIDEASEEAESSTKSYNTKKYVSKDKNIKAISKALDNDDEVNLDEPNENDDDQDVQDQDEVKEQKETDEDSENTINAKSITSKIKIQSAEPNDTEETVNESSITDEKPNQDVMEDDDLPKKEKKPIKTKPSTGGTLKASSRKKA